MQRRQWQEFIMRDDVHLEGHRAARVRDRRRGRPPFECIALLLQGGGALGVYQAGVYQALAENDLHPDWTAGISIGAINAAITAGNPPEERVEKYACRRVL
jgi:NTE family protein